MEETPLHLAAFGGQIDEVRRLLEAGADVNARTQFQGTPLHWALAGDQVNPDILSVLVEHGADVNAQNNMGNTPLHFASFTGNVPAAQRLLDLGADPTLTDSMNQTPIHRAKGKVIAFFDELKRRKAERKVNAKGLAMVSAMVKPRGEPIPYDLVREIGTNLDVKPKTFTPQSAKGRKTRVRKTKRRLTRRRK